MIKKTHSSQVQGYPDLRSCTSLFYYYLFLFFWLCEIAAKLAKSRRARRWIRTLGKSEVADLEHLVPADEDLIPADEDLMLADEDLVPGPVVLVMRFPCGGFTMKTSVKQGFSSA